MKKTILGISGSPVKDGNVDAFLGVIMEMAGHQGLATETVNLTQLQIKGCRHCNFCLVNQKTGQ